MGRMPRSAKNGNKLRENSRSCKNQGNEFWDGLGQFWSLSPWNCRGSGLEFQNSGLDLQEFLAGPGTVPVPRGFLGHFPFSPGVSRFLPLPLGLPVSHSRHSQGCRGGFLAFPQIQDGFSVDFPRCSAWGCGAWTSSGTTASSPCPCSWPSRPPWCSSSSATSPRSAGWATSPT